MQFVRNGPDIPERLLQAHEDERVVLFCGAGISYPAGLPGFARLVEKIYADLSHTPDALQAAAIKAKQFDRAIGLLEGGIVGERETVRKSLAKILTPDLGLPEATLTHEALLTLGRCRDGRMRIVTTNFDRLFEEVIAAKALEVEQFEAPLVPVPKSRWDGLVYLHGLLPGERDRGNLDRLVVSSGDFGLAYLTERWAARFVGELFRHYTVCFVGYSIDDPVLRYMTDALAADRLLGEAPREMFALGSYSKGQEDRCAGEWRAKNVTPILYREYRRHRYLHETLREWAGIYRDGIGGKEGVVVRHAGSLPWASTKQDDFVGRVLWALSDPSGGPARCFADLDPVPSLEWLEPLSEDRYRQADLDRFGVPPRGKRDKDLAFSLIRRPWPYTHAPWMALVDESVSAGRWDDVMFHLGRWLMRHLDDPKLVLWLTAGGMPIHREFAQRVEGRLRELDGLLQRGKTDELNRIREHAPRAIPGPAMRTLWRLLLTGRVKSSLLSFDLYAWLDRFKHDGLTTALRLELRDFLTPRVSVRPSFQWDDAQPDLREPIRLKDLVDCEVVLSSDHVHSVVDELRQDPGWSEALPDLLDDFSALLRDAMDLARELGGAEDREDQSYVEQPSISDHPQNMRFHDWTALIELSRDAWLATAKKAPERARRVGETWSSAPYPVFRRLAYFSATQEDIIPPRQALDWLLSDEHWWLWSVETQRETMRLLAALVPTLEAEALAELERAVLAGPPRDMFAAHIEPDDWVRTVERETWLLLARMVGCGAVLGRNARTTWEELTSQHPDWRLEPEERDEFPFWMGDGRELSRFVATPRRRRDLVEWLRQHAHRESWQEDDWRLRCENDFAVTACALCALARDGAWPRVRWREALQAWSEEKLVERSWRYMARALAEVPDEELRSLAHGVGRWLNKVAKALDRHEEVFFDLCRRLLALEYEDDREGDVDDAVTQAINHPVGHVTEALLTSWSRNPLEDGQRLPDELGSLFTELCDTRVSKFRHGRVLLAARVVTLFRVDREWTEENLLPLFDWDISETEARAAWKGYLWSPRLYRPLMETIKRPFLDTGCRYGMLGRHGGQYASLLTFAALDSGETFSRQQLAKAISALPGEGLRHAAEALVRAQEGAGAQRGGYWHNRTVPYLREIWPKSIEHLTPSVSESLAKVCIAAQTAFPEAVAELRNWLMPPRYPGHLLRRLNESQLCRDFPEEAVDFLLLVTDDSPLLGRDLEKCLRQIRSTAPQLEDDQRFKRLVERLRISGGELD